MTGTVLVALIPLYLTAYQDAVYDGAFLVVSVALLADSLFRSVDPAKWKGGVNVFFVVATVLLLMLTLLQYGPIANDMRREKKAQQLSLQSGAIGPLYDFEREREENERDLPNSSGLLLCASIIAEFSVILFLED